MNVSSINANERRMSELAVSFPSIRGAPGVQPWDALAVLRWLCEGGSSSGEKHTARFLLGVWNTGTDWPTIAREGGIQNPEQARRFDVFDAMGVWDAKHVQAFVSWLKEPFWP